MNNDIDTRLKSSFRTAFNLSPDADIEAMQFSKSREWDSIAHLLLVATIEKEFDILLDTKDLLAMSSYPISKEIVTKYLNKKT